jgi:hypothetical protein
MIKDRSVVSSFFMGFLPFLTRRMITCSVLYLHNKPQTPMPLKKLVENQARPLVTSAQPSLHASERQMAVLGKGGVGLQTDLYFDKQIMWS